MSSSDEDDTPEVEPNHLPGYEEGFTDGYRLGIVRTLAQFRLALIESGTEPGDAFLLEQQLSRWIQKHGG